MSHTLLSFLGKPRPLDTAPDAGFAGRKYREAAYAFTDGQRTTAFFAWALAEYVRPDRLLVLGTAGSAWDLLVGELPSDDPAEVLYLDLLEAVEQNRVAQPQLAALEALVSRRIGLATTLRLIPYGRDEAEQLHTLQLMADDLRAGDRVTLDVTHGLRHLPMLALVSALYLRMARGVEMAGIYYGALDLTPAGGPTPVMELSGLLRITDWVRALSTFDKDGDYGEFAGLLQADGVADGVVSQLSRAAFQERASNAHLAQQALASAASGLTGPLPGIAGLFAESLAERIRWHRRGELADWQRELARQYLARRDYLRAAIFAYEGFVTRLMDRNDDPANYERREATFRAFEGSADLRLADYWLLKNLRNALAHGNQPRDGQVRRIVREEARLGAELQRLLSALLG